MISVELERLLAYSDYERAKWKAWVSSDPARLALRFQPGARFPTIGSLLEHVFFVERRHLSRLEGAVPPTESGVTPGDGRALFEYADLVRADLRKYLEDMDELEADHLLTWTTPAGGAFTAGTYSMTRRKLIVHILLHEVRHLAQIAYAARLAGHEPPGQHDYFYCPAG